MLRNTLCFSLLATSAALGPLPARAADASPIQSDAKTLAIWTDGFAKADGDKMLGLALGLDGPLRFESKLGVQQHADPRAADTEKLIWSLATPAPRQLSRSVSLKLSAEGATDPLHGGYTQNVAGALAWTTLSTSALQSELQLQSKLDLDLSKAAAALTIGPEWVIATRSVGASPRAKAEVKAGVDYRLPNNGVASLVAKLELKLVADK